MNGMEFVDVDQRYCLERRLLEPAAALWEGQVGLWCLLVLVQGCDCKGGTSLGELAGAASIGEEHCCTQTYWTVFSMQPQLASSTGFWVERKGPALHRACFCRCVHDQNTLTSLLQATTRLQLLRHVPHLRMPPPCCRPLIA